MSPDDFHCSYLESLCAEILCWIVKVSLSESASNSRISVLHCKAFLLCLDKLAITELWKILFLVSPKTTCDHKRKAVAKI